MSLIESVFRELEPGGWVLVTIFVVASAGWIRALWWIMYGQKLTEHERNRVEEWIREQSARDLLTDGSLPDRLPGSVFVRTFVRRTLETIRASGEHNGRGIHREVDALERRVRAETRFVKTCAGVLPLLGLFGTLLGIIKSFDVLSAYGTGRVQLLGEGISQALLTTQAGLLLAIPLLFLHRYMSGKINEYVENLTLIGHQLQEHV